MARDRDRVHRSAVDRAKHHLDIAYARTVRTFERSVNPAHIEAAHRKIERARSIVDEAEKLDRQVDDSRRRGEVFDRIEAALATA